MRNRREIWRDFMGRFEPSGDPRDAVQRGFYVPRPGRSMAEQLAARFELKPSAAHLLVGGVGSGKTTQLLVARERLEAAGDICAVYADVSLRGSGELNSRTDVLAACGMALLQHLPESNMNMLAEAIFRANVNQDVSKGDPFDSLLGDIDGMRQAIGSRYPNVVLLLDALDRVSDLEVFQGIIESSVLVLRSMGIGVIVVGPLTALYGIQRAALDRFDRVWHLPAVDIQHDADGRSFLVDVLRARDVERLLTETAAERLAAFSGGVLRDLVALTQTAGEEAYVHGAEQVGVEHVEVAADLFGRKLMVGIDSQQLAVLQRVRTQGTFVQTSEKDLALLATRRVLEYSNGKPRFAVHPTIEPLLAQIPEVP